MLIRFSLLAIVLALILPTVHGQDFKGEQMQYGRVKKAYDDKGTLVRNIILSSGLDTSGFKIFVRVFKEEHIMEIWGTDSLHDEYVLLNEYHICRISGQEGPKRKQGDLQVPEGCYHINRFNP